MSEKVELNVKMSQQQVILQTQQPIDFDTENQREQIPLERMSSSEEREDRGKMRALFNSVR